MSSNFADYWQKHTPGNLEHKCTGNHISLCMFVLYHVKSSNDFYGIQYAYSVKYEVST